MLQGTAVIIRARKIQLKTNLTMNLTCRLCTERLCRRRNSLARVIASPSTAIRFFKSLKRKLRTIK